MIRKQIYLAGMKRRNPSLLQHLNFLLESDHWSLDRLKEYQFKRLKDLLIFANQYSPFYTKEFAEIGFNPENMKSIDELQKVADYRQTFGIASS